MIRLKQLVLVLFCTGMYSCLLNSSDFSFCGTKEVEDYSRIPLIQPADLIRLNGDTLWGFSLSRAKIDTPNLSSFLNIQLIGINKSTSSFFLITDSVVYNKAYFQKSAVIVEDPEGKKIVRAFYGKSSVDSIYMKQSSGFTWYEVGKIWREFDRSGHVPWCK